MFLPLMKRVLSCFMPFFGFAENCDYAPDDIISASPLKKESAPDETNSRYASVRPRSDVKIYISPTYKRS